MNLSDLAAGRTPPVAIAAIGGDRPLAIEVQQRLSAAGLLEPPPDGLFGPISQWALRTAIKALQHPQSEMLDAALAKALLSAELESIFPLRLVDDLPSRLTVAVLRRGWWLTRHPNCVNIIYVEGAGKQLQDNGNAPNRFNDQRLILQISADGTPRITGQWEGTTEPGTYYTQVMQADPLGAARIAFGQYKSWRVGKHPQSHPDKAHEALVQVADITVCRDLDQNYQRNGDHRYTGLFGINQHWGYNMSVDNIGNASAGCLVGRAKDGHRAFMRLVKSDARYAVNPGFTFMTAVLPAKDLWV